MKKIQYLKDSAGAMEEWIKIKEEYEINKKKVPQNKRWVIFYPLNIEKWEGELVKREEVIVRKSLFN